MENKDFYDRYNKIYNDIEQLQQDYKDSNLNANNTRFIMFKNRKFKRLQHIHKLLKQYDEKVQDLNKKINGFNVKIKYLEEKNTDLHNTKKIYQQAYQKIYYENRNNIYDKITMKNKINKLYERLQKKIEPKRKRGRPKKQKPEIQESEDVKKLKELFNENYDKFEEIEKIIFDQ